MMDNFFKDAILLVRPKFSFASSYDSALKSVNTLLEELTPKVQEIMPNFKLNNESDISVENDDPNTGLNPIAELEEDQEVESARDEETSQQESESEDEYEFRGQQNLEFAQKTTTDDDMNGSESDVNVISDVEMRESRETAPKTIHCPEDEDFLKDFDKMMSESLVSRSQEVVRSNTDIVIPVDRNTSKKTVGFTDGIKPDLQTKDEKVQTFNFQIMTRTKGNKPVLKKVDVPIDSELVITLKAREEAEKAEKKNIKKLILDINERREMEDRDAELERGATSGSSTANRDHRRRYQHPKGVPDVDMIFGNRTYQ